MSFGDVLSTVGIGTQPFGVSSDSDYIYTANYGSNSVSIINKTTLAVTNLSTGGEPFDVISAGGYIFVACYSSGLVSVYDAVTHASIKTIVVPNPVKLAANSQYVVVSSYNAGSGGVIDISTLTLVRTLSGLSAPRSVAIDDTYIYFANSGGNNVKVFRISDYQLVATISVGSTPVGIVFDKHNVYVINTGSTTVSVVSISSLTVVNTFTLSNSGWQCAIRDNLLFVSSGTSSSNYAQVYDVNNFAAGSFVSVITGSQPYGVAVDDTGIYVTNSVSSTLTIADASLGDPNLRFAVFKVAATADDGYAQRNTQGVSQSTFTTTYGMLLGNQQASTFWQEGVGWARFQVSVPVETVTSAVIRVSGGWNDTSMGPYCTLCANAVDDAVNPTDYTSAMALAVTVGSTDWHDSANVSTAALSSPDISTAVNEVLSRPGWVNGNHLMILSKFSPLSYGSNKNRRSSDISEQLILTYAIKTGPKVTYWDGENELTGTLYYWDGENELPITDAEMVA